MFVNDYVANPAKLFRRKAPKTDSDSNLEPTAYVGEDDWDGNLGSLTVKRSGAISRGGRFRGRLHASED